MKIFQFYLLSPWVFSFICVCVCSDLLNVTHFSVRKGYEMGWKRYRKQEEEVHRAVLIHFSPWFQNHLPQHQPRERCVCMHACICTQLWGKGNDLRNQPCKICGKRILLHRSHMQKKILVLEIFRYGQHLLV